MKHMGDITQINGAAVEPVNCITFGSPCQDLSIAGKRAGLAGQRSGLFMEATRIIKEMRRATNGVYPEFAIWENVVGAFSSNGGEDFRAVLEELARCAEPGICIPGPAKGKWAKAGCIAGDGWSIAWRTFDAQHWGVPQRRRRIAAVLDLGGQRAAEILFERQGLSGDPEPIIPAWKGSARDPKESSARHDRVLGASSVNASLVFDGERRHDYASVGEVAPTVQAKYGTGGGNTPIVSSPIPYGISSYDSNAWKSGNPHSGVYEADTANTLDSRTCGSPSCNQGGTTVCEPIASDIYNGRISGNVAASLTTASGQGASVFENHSQDSRYKELPNVCETVSAKYGTGGNNQPIVCSYGIGNGQAHTASNPAEEKSMTLDCMHDHQCVAHALLARSNCSFREDSETFIPEIKNDGGAVRWIVRRLTPTECERLQGFPDGWTDIGDWEDSKGKKHKGGSDSPRYKALGNSIALPQWWWITCKMAKFLPEGATLASLFDGIGGFPLVWETRHGAGTARWASEIEEFPIAVTKHHFPDIEADDLTK